MAYPDGRQRATTAGRHHPHAGSIGQSLQILVAAQLPVEVRQLEALHLRHAAASMCRARPMKAGARLQLPCINEQVALHKAVLAPCHPVPGRTPPV